MIPKYDTSLLMGTTGTCGSYSQLRKIPWLEQNNLVTLLAI